MVASLIVPALVSAGCADDDQTAFPTSTTTTTVPDGSPQELLDHHDDWVLPGRDYDNSRATFDAEIDSRSAPRLTQAWAAELKGPLSTVPIVVGEVVYLQDGTGTITVLHRDDGTVKWSSKPYGFNIGPFGVAVANGRVFGVSSKAVVALDAETGGELWAREITATPSGGVGIQPTVFDDMVLASTVPVSIGGIYQGGDRGVLHALDAATGDVRWTFDTVDSPDVWGNPEVNSGGGAWYPPSVDPARGLVYWGVANPAPFPGTAEYPNGSSRPGPNLYTESTVALDIDTGELRWYHQAIPHDLFDRDMVHTLIARPPGDGEVVIGTGKGGIVVGIDPESGEPLWRTEVGDHENDQLTALDGPTMVTPGTYGGVLTPPATAEGIVYAAVINAPAKLKPDETAYFGAEFDQADGEVVAIDARTGKVVWDVDVPGDPLGGVTVVNDLVLTALFDGTVLALDRETGEEVWRTEAAGGINGWMAVVDDTIYVPVGHADPPQLVAYRLR
ncbi:MAG TPA: PQQ-binding-like beta-propeller repeat protein [Microthrixaceae bacterium]|nr:PQQ-binding-like beta-propeller repeat protein [Microthrixaceae bacterium]